MPATDPVHSDVNVQTQHIYENPAFEDSVETHQEWASGFQSSKQSTTNRQYLEM